MDNTELVHGSAMINRLSRDCQPLRQFGSKSLALRPGFAIHSRRWNRGNALLLRWHRSRFSAKFRSAICRPWPTTCSTRPRRLPIPGCSCSFPPCWCSPRCWRRCRREARWWANSHGLRADSARRHDGSAAVVRAAPAHSLRQVIFSAASLSVFAGLGMMLSLMEGFRRAYRLPRDEWGFWERRCARCCWCRLSLVPLALATLVLVFGHQIELWMIESRPRIAPCRAHFLAMVRWTVALRHQRRRARRALSFRHHGARSTGWGRSRRNRRTLCGFRPRWPLAGMSPALPTTPCFTVRLAPASRLWCGFTSPLSARCSGRS